MSTLRLERLIAADPTGTALLLAGRDWPGVARVSPPRRLPTAFVVTFALGAAEGAVTLTRSWVAGHAATAAVLTLTWPDGEPGTGAALRAWADGFLTRLAVAAEDRAYAA